MANHATPSAKIRPNMTYCQIPIVKIGILGIQFQPMAKNPEHRDLFPGALEIMILQSLRLKPMHGYALVKHIKQVSDDLLQVEEGSLYPALQRMLKEGWLAVEAGTSAKGRPTRIYRLTDAGIRAPRTGGRQFREDVRRHHARAGRSQSVGGVACHCSVACFREKAGMTTSPCPSRSTSTSGSTN